MRRRKLIKNKILAVMLMIIGMLTVFIEWDATCFLFTVLIGFVLFFADENRVL